MSGFPIHKLTQAFKTQADPEKACFMKKYMKDLFPFYGIQAGPRRAISRALLKETGLPDKKNIPEIIRMLWGKDEREYQHFAVELLAKYKRDFESEDLGLIHWMITHKPWWDSVDFIATNLAGPYFSKFPEKRYAVCSEWLESGHMWLQRTTLLFQLKYKKETDLVLLTRQIRALKSEKDFFIRKAIGWALREYSKTDPEWVTEFVKEVELAPLSEREALKWMRNSGIVR